MIEKIFPAVLERHAAPEALEKEVSKGVFASELAVRVQGLETRRRPGAIERGRGWCRVDFTTGESSAVLGAFPAKRRNGDVVLIYNAGATTKAHVKPAAAQQDSDYGL